MWKFINKISKRIIGKIEDILFYASRYVNVVVCNFKEKNLREYPILKIKIIPDEYAGIDIYSCEDYFNSRSIISEGKTAHRAIHNYFYPSETTVIEAEFTVNGYKEIYALLGEENCIELINKKGFGSRIVYKDVLIIREDDYIIKVGDKIYIAKMPHGITTAKKNLLIINEN